MGKLRRLLRRRNTEVLVSFAALCTKTSVWKIRADDNTINRILHKQFSFYYL